MIAVELAPDLEARVAALAKSTGRTIASVAHEAIVQQLEDLEDYYEAAKVAKNPGRVYSSGEVERELGL
ncbi:toxin-antitoxin system antitoxin subunit [Akkermansiaceae bacterium]|nr:toxin-antitoxin system antitoxin subunit [Akkermansiaceae bacterium]